MPAPEYGPHSSVTCAFGMTAVAWRAELLRFYINNGGQASYYTVVGARNMFGIRTLLNHRACMTCLRSNILIAQLMPGSVVHAWTRRNDVFPPATGVLCHHDMSPVEEAWRRANIMAPPPPSSPPQPRTTTCTICWSTTCVHPTTLI